MATQRTFLPPEPLRAAAERRLWAIGHAIADLYPRRPEPPAASWVADSD